jgi:hypothetical protein
MLNQGPSDLIRAPKCFLGGVAGAAEPHTAALQQFERPQRKQDRGGLIS